MILDQETDINLQVMLDKMQSRQEKKENVREFKLASVLWELTKSFAQGQQMFA